MYGNQNDSGMNIAQLENVAINVVENVCASVAWPVEMILRPWHGTRYCPVPVIFFSTMLMISLPAFSALTDTVTQLLPGMGIRPPKGLFGIESLSKLYFILSLIHGIRRWRLMIHMEREAHSRYEGNPLPFIDLIPGSGSFWKTRIIIEPCLVFVAATILGRIFIFQTGLTFYLQIAALCLAMKEYIDYYKAWIFLRDLFDARFVGSLMGRMFDGHATEQELNMIHMAGFPANVPPQMRQEAVFQMARSFSVDLNRNQGESHDS